ncbi:MAG: shikimate dehydrogenase [Alphaproteobacteria bacterium]
MSADPKACVVGWPIAHSRSPLIHGHWLKTCGLAGSYVLHPLEEALAEGFFKGLGNPNSAAGTYVGCNVTLPHKQCAWRCLARPTRIADQLRAANTLWLEDGVLCGDNTDVYGFLANLDDCAAGWDKGGPAVVIGAGGAARAVVHALLSRGHAPVTVVNRTRERAQRLADDLTPAFGHPISGDPVSGIPVSGGGAGNPVAIAGLDDIDTHIATASVIVNTTSASLHGAAPLTINWQRANPDALVADIVYVPLITPFLAGAQSAGLRICDGIGMLLHQAVPGFERWFGQRPVVDDDLRAMVIADMDAG